MMVPSLSLKWVIFPRWPSVRHRSASPVTLGVEGEKVPIPDSCAAANATLFDNLIGAREQRRRDVDAERLGRLEIDYKLILGRHLHRQVSRLLALEDAVNVAGRPPIIFQHVISV